MLLVSIVFIKKHWIKAGVLTACFLSGCQFLSPTRAVDELDSASSYGVLPTHQTQNGWFAQAQSRLREKLECVYCSSGLASQAKAKNIILFVGDGMGVSTVTASRIYAGQQAGAPGEENLLSFEKLPYTGLVKTYNVNAQVPDSAGTMTALVTGVKTNFGAVGVDEQSQRGNCASQKGKELMSALELAELAGMATGIVSTARITHATPAANYAKAVERDWEYTTPDMGCADIAQQLLDFEARLKTGVSVKQPGVDTAHIDGLDVVLGGGSRNFTAKDNGGKRLDGKDLLTSWLSGDENRYYVSNADELTSLEINEKTKLLGLFSGSHMAYEEDRNERYSDQPSLTAMSLRALEVVKTNTNGYFLQIESARIDHGHHAGSARTALIETVEFSNAISAVLDEVDLSETLVLVTADHSHVMTMAGYPRRGNSILGFVEPVQGMSGLAEDGLPYTTLSYANGRGVRQLNETLSADEIYKYKPEAGRSSVRFNVTKKGYHQEALVPLAAETHGGEDVAIYAAGPGAHLVSGVMEQHMVFHIMNHAAQLEARAAHALH